VYVEVFRGTSLLVQIFYFYFVLPVIGLTMTPFWAGVLAISMNAGAYGSEIVRGALTAVERGQRDAIIALNLNPLRSFVRVILPQAAVRMILPFGNLLIELLKSTPLLSLIAISDLLYRGQMYVSLTGRTAEIFTVLLIMYFLLGWPLVKAVGAFHSYMSRGNRNDV
jgi:polar amino acid transport system permease protein